MPEDLEACHYVWAGPPAAGKFAGHDTIGPDLLSKASPKQPIYFYCLAAYTDEYKKHFVGKNIEVRSIEAYTEQREPAFYQFVKQLSERAPLHEKESDTFREYVTIKAATQIFLQQFESGYFMDTNIIPCLEYEGERLPKLHEFSAPFVHNIGKSSYDPWLMYSPEDDPSAEDRFKYYYQEAKGIYDRHTPDFPRTIPYPHGEFSQAILGPSFVFQARSARKIETTAKRPFKDSLTLLGMKKRYYNTHKDTNLRDIPLLHRVLVDKEAIDEFKYLFQHQDHPAIELYQFNGRYTTLLHEAVKSDNQTALEYLLGSIDDNLALFRTVMEDPSALSLSIGLGTPDCFHLLMQDYLSKHNLTEQQFVSVFNGLGQILNPYLSVSPLEQIDSIDALWSLLKEASKYELYNALFESFIYDVGSFSSTDGRKIFVEALKEQYEPGDPDDKAVLEEHDRQDSVTQSTLGFFASVPDEEIAQPGIDEENVLAVLDACLHKSMRDDFG